MARVLGVSFNYHDSAAALVVDGKPVAAAAEERFCRRKHTSEFPKHAIAYCLEAGGVTLKDIDAVVFYEKPMRKFFRVLETMVNAWPRGLASFATQLPPYLKSKFNVYSAIEKNLPEYRGQILFSEHHLSHAASAYYCSPFQDAAILTIDGVGESETTTIGHGKDRDIQLLKAIHFPHSLGLFYSALTSYLGFKVNDAEWKVMGLAPYGKPIYLEKFRKMFRLGEEGSFCLDLDYFSHHFSAKYSANPKKWEELLGVPMRKTSEELVDVHHDLARSGQAMFEEVALHLAGEAKRITGAKHLVIAGGGGLNSVANWHVESSGIFEKVWIQPAAGDDGGALGAALAVSQMLFKDKRTPEMRDAYLGPEIDEAEVRHSLSQRKIVFKPLSEDELIKEVVELLVNGKVIGWARGRMEFGPRSLGSRSILASPLTAKMKETVNAKVKYREFFRPFAPSLPLEHVHEYFDVAPGTELPFMLKIPSVLASKRKVIPAVTHEDGTGRVQTVTREGNELFYRLLKAFGECTGVPVLLNTSFNIRGEPVVCNFEDAMTCFERTGLDALVAGRCLITQKSVIALSPEQGYALSNELEVSGGAVTRKKGERS